MSKSYKCVFIIGNAKSIYSGITKSFNYVHVHLHTVLLSSSANDTISTKASNALCICLISLDYVLGIFQFAQCILNFVLNFVYKSTNLNGQGSRALPNCIALLYLILAHQFSSKPTIHNSLCINLLKTPSHFVFRRKQILHNHFKTKQFQTGPKNFTCNSSIALQQNS